jgi:hypothetical protein
VGSSGTASPGSPVRSAKACRDGFSVLYKRTSRLFADLAQARSEGLLARDRRARARSLRQGILFDHTSGPGVAMGRRHCRPNPWRAISDRIIHNAHPSSSKATVYGVRPAKRKSRKHLAPDRATGPSRARRYVARGDSTPRTGPSHGPPGRSSKQPASLDEEAISSTLNPSAVFSSAPDHDH